MDTNLQVLTALKANIDSQVTGLQAQSAALADAIALETSGYQSDQDTIAAAIVAALSPISTSIVSTITANTPAVIATPPTNEKTSA